MRQTAHQAVGSEHMRGRRTKVRRRADVLTCFGNTTRSNQDHALISHVENGTKRIILQDHHTGKVARESENPFRALAFPPIDYARTGIRTRVESSTGFHDGPLHHPDTTDPASQIRTGDIAVTARSTSTVRDILQPRTLPG